MTVNGTEAGSSWREYTDQGLSKVLAAALAAFVEKGYDGASIREIAARAGLSVPGLYHHYPSKQALLVGLTNAVMRDLLDRSRAAVAEAGPTPGERFDAVIESLLRFHMYRREQSFVASRETRSMEPDSRQAYIALRDEQQQLVDDIVRDGVAAGLFRTPFPEDASRAVVTMCVSVATWYREDGPLSPDEIVERYLVIARSTVGAID
ncbi:MULTISPECIES: TetR/AcrR family transcriptional regulator [Rhodococcus]|uniref:TetR/AcrR family transcriptional regulator n=1 Tax=Rhodococcus oxybenzonivorans TaxID=1990687 RepID=A0AAE4V0Y6_9NOCA|nr:MULTISPECIES: TetR/AcrR family transcriptional regulator [Rhodococcus]MDV7241321.1 TetR/AcrR family transcriptional regulator [Rhodococcus oxybenzonivorans]MDV7265981.1 TetR/AcrR family transcriptional regulator [Rhodococcus oxybenzonivorans]MDV7274146.1 TetR/AcrR family transcriptional regulator [Rhodococcus oxybenzonivorans]MDV7333601.1 TetR/AcrR family transcriptional regulator [Rhodococcus oxybenzonivorans]MDV7343021.1 TetR/AcrR family transcriptional regulator [Rhodococcus oxybenzonivo